MILSLEFIWKIKWNTFVSMIEEIIQHFFPWSILNKEKLPTYVYLYNFL